MKNLSLLIIVICLNACSYNSIKHEEKRTIDLEYREKIIGTWTCEDVPGVIGDTTYKIDGTLSGDATMKLGGNVIYVHVEGKWEIKDGYILEQYLECSIPELLNTMKPGKDKIISFNDDNETLTIITKSGEKHIHKRKN